MSPERDRHVELRLPSYMTGELSKEDAGRIEAHLETCEECARAFRDLRDLRETLAADPNPTPRPVWPALADRIGPQKRPAFEYRFALGTAAAVAAGVLLGLFLGASDGTNSSESSYSIWSSVGSSYAGEGSLSTRLYEVDSTEEGS